MSILQLIYRKSQSILISKSQQLYDNYNYNNCIGWIQQLLKQQSDQYYYHWWQQQIQFQPQLVGMNDMYIHQQQQEQQQMQWNNNNNHNLLPDLSIWFAVPKRKVTPGKKRMKTTLRTRIPLRYNIITDPRTGELTLKHHLPKNWKAYLPNTINPKDTTNDNNNKNDTDDSTPVFN